MSDYWYVADKHLNIISGPFLTRFGAEWYLKRYGMDRVGCSVVNEDCFWREDG